MMQIPVEGVFLYQVGHSDFVPSLDQSVLTKILLSLCIIIHMSENIVLIPCI